MVILEAGAFEKNVGDPPERAQRLYREGGVMSEPSKGFTSAADRFHARPTRDHLRRMTIEGSVLSLHREGIRFGEQGRSIDRLTMDHVGEMLD